MEKLLQQRENAEVQNPQNFYDPNRRIYRFTNRPLAQVLRALAETAGINYVEPGIPPTEQEITVSLHDMDPIQAFRAVAKARGFKVIGPTEEEIYTLERSDIPNPSYYETRAYTLKYKTPAQVAQAVAGILGVNLRQSQGSTPALPRPSDDMYARNGVAGSERSAGGTTVGGFGGPGGIGQLNSGGTTQTRPRFTPGMTFDAPLSRGGYGPQADQGGQNAIWWTGNALWVRATPQEHELIAAQLAKIDRLEPQIQIKTYLVEVNNSNLVDGGIDWSQTLGANGATFTLTGSVGSGGGISSMFHPGFFNSGLVLKFPDVSATVRALESKGVVANNGTPFILAYSGVPQTIRSVTNQTIFLQTAGTTEIAPTTQPYVFTTGLTIDFVATILKGGYVDLNMNPILSTKVGDSPAQPGTNTTVPITAERQATLNVRVKSGDAVVFGGVLQDSMNNQDNGVPGLRKIPVIGYFFKSRRRENNRSNLIIIVQATIVGPTQKRYDRLGETERYMLDETGDLPGEPPRLPQRYEKNVVTPGKRIDTRYDINRKDY